MSGSAFPAAPSAAPANTVYFGHLPDKFNSLKIGFVGHAFAGATSINDANFGNQWTIYNQNQAGGGNVPTTSFGGFITAPDGTTNTAQKIVESTSNTVHSVLSVWPTNHGGGLFKYRVSVFANATGAGRTRFAIYVGGGTSFDPSLGNLGNGIKVVFDLAGGQIGVAPALFGNTGNGPMYISNGAEIVPFGSGWYRCTLDMQMGQADSNFYGFGILLDNGSGTGAESTSYTGDGSSGLYIWKTTALPARAWGLNNTAFFDDFTALSDFDLLNVFDPTKTWFLNNKWPAFGGAGGLTPTDPTKLSIVGGTQVHIGDPSGTDGLAFMTAAWTGIGLNTVSSFLYSPPVLAECSMSWPGGTNLGKPPPTFWTTNIHRLLGPVAGTDGRSTEFDYFEWTPGGAPTAFPGYSIFSPCAPSGEIVGAIACATGTPIWYSTYTYPNSNWTVFNTFDGQRYQITSAASTNERPDLFPAKWTNLGAPTNNDVGIDWNQQHVFSVLWLPQTADDLGHIQFFFDGKSVGQSNFIYGNFVPNQPGPPPPISQASIPFNVSDGQQWPLMIGTTPGITANVDFVRVTQ